LREIQKFVLISLIWLHSSLDCIIRLCYHAFIMKPQDLVPPHSRDDRRVCVHDRIWYVPMQFSQNTREPLFLFPGWDHPDFFGNNNPVNIEYCSGNGAWIAERAVRYPHINWIAVERKFDRVRKLWSKVHNLKVSNLLVLCGEAYHATEKFFPTGTIDEVFINFPDPWPKRRHTQNRLIQLPFLNQLGRVLKDNGKVTVVTDDEPHSQWLIGLMKENGNFASTYPDPFYTTDCKTYGTSYFEDLWRSQGKTIYYHEFIRHGHP